MKENGGGQVLNVYSIITASNKPQWLKINKVQGQLDKLKVNKAPGPDRWLTPMCPEKRSTDGYHCTQREGTSFTVLMDAFIVYSGYAYNFGKALKSVSARFPCVTRQYTSVILDYAETNETITNDWRGFLQSIPGDYWNDYSTYENYYYHSLNCNQSLLYGLKRALQISPAESIIWVNTFGSMTDYNDTQLLSDVHTLLEEKKSQVNFLFYPNYCTLNGSQRDVLNDISSLSYGQVISLNYDNYKVYHSLALLLSKPLNSSVRILNINENVSDNYTDTFNVPTSLSYLLITGAETFTLNFTDPNGKTLSFEKHTNFYYHFLYNYRVNYGFLSPHLVKSPAAGSWILNTQGNTLLSVQILGITGLDKPDTCSDSDCHPNATCTEFGGYGECTCKEGFAGDGTSCNDIDECQDYYYNNCYYYDGCYCVNTIGSYFCNCYSGFEYTEEIGCLDIDECANSSLNNCDPVAICRNYYGYYTCICPYGYYGDGYHCEINECLQGTPCGSNEECMKAIGSYSCIDPCSNHTVLNDPWRSTSNTYNYNNWNYWYHCDYGLSGWYRFKGEYDQQIPEHCIPQDSCGTTIPIWMNGSHPTVSDGIVNRAACSNWYDGCCTYPYNISVKMCPGGFYIYKLQSPPSCNFAYCTESNYSCSGVDCAPDEECRIVGGVPGCYCKSGIQQGNLADDLKPQVTCGLENIEVRFRKCLVEKWGYSTSSIHLRDYSCQGIIERSDKSYITFITRPADGSCGGSRRNNGSVIRYTNTIYLASSSDGVIVRDDIPIDFYCDYPSNMEINLLTAISSYVVSVINVAGTANFTITMGLFQDSGYTTPYTDSQAWLSSSSILYVGVIVTGATGSSPFVLVMKNCYATPTADSSYGPRYDILTNQCPNKNDPTLSVAENGVSLKGRFSLQVFKFLGGFSQIYLHCQVGLCDTSNSYCAASCPAMRSASIDNNNVNNIIIGPIYQKAAVSSVGAATVPPVGEKWDELIG
ncbi:uromodulin-like [Aquarana catesbeiana]|uniref:uromodulin-like n=1 Tax=Aquarana catesbeiana TaxID=8400 RepID=UPI003CC93EE1